MQIVRTVIASCVFVGLVAGAALAKGGAAAPAGGAAGAAPAGAAKPADKAAPPAGDKAAAGAMMEMPKPPAEIAEMSKQMVGAWNCTGKVGGPDGQMRDTSGKLQFSVDLDKWWIKASLTETKTKTPYKFNSFVTFDATSKKWTNVSIDNVGGYRVLTSDGPKDKVVTWMGNATAMGHTVQVKATHTAVSDKDTKIDESISMDGGKTWVPTVAVECKK
jgi:Protein of unknown function (DUF1579)